MMKAAVFGTTWSLWIDSLGNFHVYFLTIIDANLDELVMRWDVHLHNMDNMTLCSAKLKFMPMHWLYIMTHNMKG